MLHSARAQSAAFQSSRARRPAGARGARLNCPKCNAKLVPKPVPGANRFPQRLECPEHGWLKETSKTNPHALPQRRAQLVMQKNTDSLRKVGARHAADPPQEDRARRAAKPAVQFPDNIIQGAAACPFPPLGCPYPAPSASRPASLVSPAPTAKNKSSRLIPQAGSQTVATSIP